MAEAVRENRRPAQPDNPFLQLQRAASKQIEDALDQYRDARDELIERMFKTIYESPWLAPMVGVGAKAAGTTAPARRPGSWRSSSGSSGTRSRASSSRGRRWTRGRG